MDKLNTIYQELFSIKFTHAAFGTAGPVFISDLLGIYPDAQTEALFSNNSIGYRFDNNTFSCFARCSLVAPPAADPKVCFTRIAADVRLRFMLTAENAFFPPTDINRAGSAQVYYFNNKANVGSGMYITQAIATVTDADLKDSIVIAPQDKCLGVIDIFSAGAVNTSYELFKGANKTLKSPAYKITFKSK
jgi:hypothetical protein